VIWKRRVPWFQSREIIRKKTGTITVFAFDQGQGLSEHIAPFDALVHVLDGQAEITISGKPYQLEAGDMIILPSGKVHAVSALTRFKMMLLPKITSIQGPVYSASRHRPPRRS
jgi:quercetin dioxygenase-like cupin family protein